MGSKKAVVLLSGGIDSATTLALAKLQGYELYALTIDYGQRHKKELESARKIAEYYKVKAHKIFKIHLNEISQSALTDLKMKVPRNRATRRIGTGIPPTYVPARNINFLSLGLAWAETLGADAVFIGAHATDYSGYPDCRPEFFKAYQKAVDLGTKTGVEGKKIEIKYPLINMTKKQIIETGMKLDVPFQFTWSCYLGGKKACGKCDACLFRLKGFKEVGLKDPIEYEVVK